MADVVEAFGWGEGVEEATDREPEGFAGSFGGLAQERLQLGEGELDRVEIGAVGRQKEQVGAAGVNQLGDLRALVAGQVVENEGVAWPEFRDEHLTDVLGEDRPVHRAIEHERSEQALAGQPCKEGGRLPMAGRGAAEGTLADRGPGVAARHVGPRTGLVEEDQAAGEVTLGLAPGGAPLGDVRALLLAGAHGFF